MPDTLEDERPSVEPDPDEHGSDGQGTEGSAADESGPAAPAAPEGPALEDALAAAVAAVGGSDREGQQHMAQAVADAFAQGRHLLAQAGTGTGKSLAYLVPSVLHAVRDRETVVVATATIALQRQLVERDLPRVAEALEPLLDRRPTYAILKGRHHYLCRHRLNEGSPADDGDMLFEPAPSTALGRDVQRIREWAEETESGDRDELVPAPAERAWRSLSVNAHECLGVARCPYASTCFSERAREAARRADVVVTNHAMLAIDAMSGIPLLPEHDVVVVDEAHELVDRATGAVTDELTAGLVDRAARRARKHVGAEAYDDLLAAGEFLTEALAETEPGRIEELRGALFDAAVAVRDASHAVMTGFAGEKGSSDGGEEQAARVQAKAAVEDVWEMAGRIVAAGEHDVVWVTASERRAPTLWRAPLSVAGLLRETLFTDRTAVLTSATLTLGGSFEPVAGGLGLVGDEAPEWTGLDVGSPFRYGEQGILYVAAHLPPPGRTGLSEELLEELAGLVEAAGGRTLGLFSSMRAAEQAAEEVRGRISTPVLCQGEDATAELVRAFAADPATSLFGTLSLWQGVDVPGGSCSLVVIDRIPFPRPDDPLATARARAIAKAGGNGFMAVSATSAALLLAQGSGRLIRSGEDRGVVAVLDSRLSTARYAPFLVRSMPPFWRTESGDVARAALQRLVG